MGWDRNNVLQYLFRYNLSKARLTSIKKLVIGVLDQSTTAIIKI